MISSKIWKIAIASLALGGIVVGGILSYAALFAGKTIHDLLGENSELREAISNLAQEDQVGYAKVVSQETIDGATRTRMLFVVTDREDPTARVIEREVDIDGDVVFFDALIVKFGGDIVMDGKEKSLLLWRRLYGENTPPSEGHPIEIEGSSSPRYTDLSSKLSLAEQEIFWTEIWNLADNPDRLSSLGVQALYGNAVYRRVRPGVIYVFHIEATGALYVEAVADL